MNTFEYKGRNVIVETSQEYTWSPIRYVFSINGQYHFRLTSSLLNRRLRKFPSAKQAENAAKRFIDTEEEVCDK